MTMTSLALYCDPPTAIAEVDEKITIASGTFHIRRRGGILHPERMPRSELEARANWTPRLLPHIINRLQSHLVASSFAKLGCDIMMCYHLGIPRLQYCK